MLVDGFNDGNVVGKTEGMMLVDGFIDGIEDNEGIFEGLVDSKSEGMLLDGFNDGLEDDDGIFEGLIDGVNDGLKILMEIVKLMEHLMVSLF